VSISSTEKPLLSFVLQAFGCGKITNKRISKALHSPSFTYAVYNRQALELLNQLHPWLKSYKRQRAELILRDYVRLTPRNGKYSEQVAAAREAFVHDVLAIKANSGR
jgi:hypothetical protein